MSSKNTVCPIVHNIKFACTNMHILLKTKYIAEQAKLAGKKYD